MLFRGCFIVPNDCTNNTIDRGFIGFGPGVVLVDFAEHGGEGGGGGGVGGSGGVGGGGVGGGGGGGKGAFGHDEGG